MSDDELPLGVCHHGQNLPWCPHCLLEELDQVKAERDRLRAASQEHAAQMDDTISGRVLPNCIHGKHPAWCIICVTELYEKAEEEKFRLLRAIAEHHHEKADDRCVEDDDILYAAAGLPPCDRRVGSKEEMLANCASFIERRCEGGGWPSYRQLEGERDQLIQANSSLVDARGRLDARCIELNLENGRLYRRVEHLERLATVASDDQG